MDVNASNTEEVKRNNAKRLRQNYKKVAVPRKSIPVGARVRISRDKGTFGRGYEANWSTEEFIVSNILKNPHGTKMYKIKDLSGEEIKGSFYAQELQVIHREEEVYQVDKVLKTRRRNGRPEYFVHWQGYPASMNSWVTDLEPLGNVRRY